MILVTGASGLVGGALVRLLAQERLRTKVALRRKIALPSGVDFHQIGDLGPETQWQGALFGVDAVVHAAARVHQMEKEGPAALDIYRLANTLGTLTLARQAAEAGVKRFVFVSTVKVMGEESPEGRPFSAQDPPAPADPYAISKWEAEQGLAEISRQTGMAVAVLRPPLVYGPGVKANMLSLARLIARGLPLPLGAIRNRRSLVGVDNLASALKLLATHPKASGATCLIQDATLSTPDLVRAIATAMERKAWLVGLPPFLLRLGAGLTGRSALAHRLLSSLAVNDEPLRRDLGWSPLISLEESMRRMILALRASQDL
jgi:nucleoside-diphosphate-sugar epimerase